MKNINKILLSALIVPMLLSPIKAMAGETTTYYTVQNGDSLWRISTKVGVSMEYLKIVNNLGTLNINNLLPGQVLKLIPDVHNYTVKSGDTLWKIATANKSSVEYLKVLNKLNSYIINVGQVIKLKPDTITYTVMQGDTLYLISKKFGSTVDIIKILNNLTGTNLLLKQQLLIPYNAQQTSYNSLVSVPTPAPVVVQNPVVIAPTAPVIVQSPVVVSPSPIVIVPNPEVIVPNPVVTLPIPVSIEAAPQPIKDFPSVTYIVQAGNTASSIGKLFNVAAADIMKYNYMGINDWFSIGQKIAINGYAPRDYAVVPGMDKSPTQYGNLVDWFRDGQYLLKRNDVFTIVDFATSKQFTVKVMGGYTHSDIEPLTTSDTAVMKSLFNEWNWTPRPVVIFHNGMNIAGSLSGMPHSFDTTPDNGVIGHFDLYLKNSLPHAGAVSQTYVQQHYSNIIISSGLK